MVVAGTTAWKFFGSARAFAVLRVIDRGFSGADSRAIDGRARSARNQNVTRRREICTLAPSSESASHRTRTPGNVVHVSKPNHG